MAGIYEELRMVANDGEPDQRIYLAWEGEDGPPDRVSSSGSWRDGLYSCGYDRGSDGRYLWWRDRGCGVVATVEEAWEELPAMIADPDYSEVLPPGFSASRAARLGHEYMALHAILDLDARRRLRDRIYAADGPPEPSELREVRLLEMRLGADQV